jgi:catechol 2,3-dioxygenase
MGPVHLSVSELARSVGFWTSVVGLEVLEQGGGRASLGSAGEELLVLVEEPGAAPAHGYAGLFHVALLVPSRRDLAAWLAHVARDRVPLQGLSDHFVSEAIYLGDPDGHGIEVYADRPREHWEGQVERMTTVPLDTDSLLGELEGPASEPFERLADGTTVGHVHLRVAEIPAAVDFYRDRLGFELMATYGHQAAFLAAGGYHHHLGANTWQSAGAPQAPAGTARLLHATVLLPEAARDELLGSVEYEESPEGPLVRDPSGNGLVLAAA